MRDETPGFANRLRLVTVVVSILFALPAAFVLWRTITLGGSIGDTLERAAAPLWRTIQLAVLVSFSAAILGTGLAWLVTRTDLPGRRMFRILLVLPLAFPSFVGAAALIAGLAPGGVLHTLFEAVGVEPPRRFRGLGASWLTLTAFTFPYVFLPVGARLLTLPASLDESGRLLGASTFERFRRIVLPQLRGSIVAGVLIVALYTLSEFGAVQLLGYDTLTRVIFASQLSNPALSFTAAAVLLLAAITISTAERSLRGSAAVDDLSQRRAAAPIELGALRIPAAIGCAAIVGLSLVIPVSSLGVWALRGLRDGRVDLAGVIGPSISTALVSVAAAVLAVALILPVALTSIRHRHKVSDVASVAIMAGFAVPGLVIALSLAVAALRVPGLGWLYQTMPLLLFAYVIHFGTQALGAAETGVRAVPDRVRESARLLGASPWRRALRVELPLMSPGLLAGGGLVMLSTIKELPATLMLSPIGFETLSTDLWNSFEDGFYAEVGVTALALVLVSGLLTWLLVLRRSPLND